MITHQLSVLEPDGELPGFFSQVRGKLFGHRAWRVQCCCSWKEKAETEELALRRFRLHQKKEDRNVT